MCYWIGLGITKPNKLSQRALGSLMPIKRPLRPARVLSGRYRALSRKHRAAVQRKKGNSDVLSIAFTFLFPLDGRALLDRKGPFHANTVPGQASTGPFQVNTELSKAKQGHLRHAEYSPRPRQDSLRPTKEPPRATQGAPKPSDRPLGQKKGLHRPIQGLN